MKRTTALLIVDLQNDFCPNGALAIQDGDLVIEPLNRIAAHFATAGLPIIATRDWHPPVTRHFAAYGGVWPRHCLQGSPGAAFHPALQLPNGTAIVSKGSDPDQDAYSAFDGKAEDGTTLATMLTAWGVQHLCIGGLATDFCVLSSTLDARRAGFEVTLLTDAVAGVDRAAGDSVKALDQMQRAGARLTTTAAYILEAEAHETQNSGSIRKHH